MKTDHHRSAGGLVVRGASILLISTQSGRRWQLPKGHIEEGETPEQAAVREVREETGRHRPGGGSPPGGRVLVRREGAPAGSTSRWTTSCSTYVSGDTADFDAREVSGADWFSWDEGIAQLSFENERRVVRAGARRIARRDPASGWTG